jgi:hypothetical protein
MLDYVYFRTEPMEKAERGKPLDFSKIERISPPRLRDELPASTQRQQFIDHTRKQLLEKKPRTVDSRPKFTPPPYDEIYFEAVNRMRDDDE